MRLAVSVLAMALLIGACGNGDTTETVPTAESTAVPTPPPTQGTLPTVEDWETTPVKQLLDLGVAEFIERPVLPELLLHRLGGATTKHYETISETLLTHQGLVQCINSSMPGVRVEGRPIGILVILSEAGGFEAVD